MTIIEKLNDLKKYLSTSKTVLGKSVIDVDKIKEIVSEIESSLYIGTFSLEINSEAGAAVKCKSFIESTDDETEFFDTLIVISVPFSLSLL